MNYYGFCYQATALIEFIRGELRRGCYVHLGRFNNKSPFSIPKPYGANLGGEMGQTYYITAKRIHGIPLKLYIPEHIDYQNINQTKAMSKGSEQNPGNPNRKYVLGSYLFTPRAVRFCLESDLEISQARYMTGHLAIPRSSPA